MEPTYRCVHARGDRHGHGARSIYFDARRFVLCSNSKDLTRRFLSAPLLAARGATTLGRVGCGTRLPGHAPGCITLAHGLQWITVHGFPVPHVHKAKSGAIPTAELCPTVNSHRQKAEMTCQRPDTRRGPDRDGSRGPVGDEGQGREGGTPELLVCMSNDGLREMVPVA